MQQCAVLPANIAREEEEFGECRKEEKRNKMHRKEAKKQETNMTKLGEGTVT